jgi:elongator complex protein 1
VTPFTAANIPPPLALHEISVGSNAIDVAFNGNMSIAVLHQDGISVFDYKSFSASTSPPIVKDQYTFKGTESSESFYQQLCFSQSREVLVLRRCTTGSIVTRYGQHENPDTIEEKFSNSPASVLSTLSSFFEDNLAKPFAQDISGNLNGLLAESLSLSFGKFPTNLPWVEVVRNDDSHIAFGMSANGHLYANSRLLVKNCTSFLVTPAHLIFTTTAHLVKFVHITNVDSMSTPFCLSPCNANFQKV